MLDRSSADPASNLNRIQQEIPSALDNAAVDVHTLVGRTKAREFIHQFLEKVISDNAGCSPRLPDADRAIIVVSDSIIFPNGTNSEPAFLTAVTTVDAVGHMLSSLHPRTALNFVLRLPRSVRGPVERRAFLRLASIFFAVTVLLHRMVFVSEPIKRYAAAVTRGREPGTVFTAATNDWAQGLTLGASQTPIDTITRNVLTRLGASRVFLLRRTSPDRMETVGRRGLVLTPLKNPSVV